MTTLLTDEQIAKTTLPAITDDERAFLHYNPNTDDLVAWVQGYALRAIEQAVLSQPAQDGGEAHPSFRKDCCHGHLVDEACMCAAYDKAHSGRGARPAPAEPPKGETVSSQPVDLEKLYDEFQQRFHREYARNYNNGYGSDGSMMQIFGDGFLHDFAARLVAAQPSQRKKLALRIEIECAQDSLNEALEQPSLDCPNVDVLLTSVQNNLSNALRLLAAPPSSEAQK